MQSHAENLNSGGIGAGWVASPSANSRVADVAQREDLPSTLLHECSVDNSPDDRRSSLGLRKSHTLVVQIANPL